MPTYTEYSELSGSKYAGRWDEWATQFVLRCMQSNTSNRLRFVFSLQAACVDLRVFFVEAVSLL